MTFVSNCCGAPNRATCYGGPDYIDLEMCPNCKEHCEFINTNDEFGKNPYPLGSVEGLEYTNQKQKEFFKKTMGWNCE